MRGALNVVNNEAVAGFPRRYDDALRVAREKRPELNATLSEWLEFHKYVAELFAAVAESDPWNARRCHFIRERQIAYADHIAKTISELPDGEDPRVAWELRNT
ncbi:AMED_5909 family protein [Amycolatopsis sp. WAC 04182]|uniref:AMED_5909 family protein n=1 Tax=Amycolatopsis sp. WAC 04182 TaxID=2203198 RepID=UPI003518380F